MSEYGYKTQDKKHRIIVLLAILILIFEAIAELRIELWYKIHTHYFDIIAISFIAVCFYLRNKLRSREEKLIWFYILWAFITRILNGDAFLFVDYSAVMRQLCLSCTFFSIGFLLDSDDRKKFLNIAIWVVSLYWLVLAVLGLYACLHQTRVSLPFIEATVGLGKYGGYYLLTVDYTNKNTTGLWFSLGTILMICQFIRGKNVLFRIITAVFATIFYVAASMSFSRAAQISLCVAIALLFILLALERCHGRKALFKSLVILAITVTVVPLGYKSTSLISNGFSIVSEKIISGKANELKDGERIDGQTQSITEITVDYDNAQEVMPEPIPQEIVGNTNTEQEEDIIYRDNRDESNLLILGGRIPLWRSGLIVLQEEPVRLIKGGLTTEYMKRVADTIYERFDRNDPCIHMHNFLFDSLLLTGVVGFVLLLVFTILLTIKMVRLFFYTGNEVNIELRLLILPMALLLVDNMMEAHLFRYELAHTSLFFIIAGSFLAWYYELFPKK